MTQELQQLVTMLSKLVDFDALEVCTGFYFANIQHFSLLLMRVHYV